MQLYNSLTRKKDRFVPRKGKKVTMYICGITPYDTTHLGHAFTYMSFDALLRYLTHKGYRVLYTQNVTDIDDDIIKKARETHTNWRELGNVWTKQYLSDMKALNIQFPTYYVRATDSIEKMQQIIHTLLKKGHAYQSKGNIYFSIQSFPDYGKLSRFRREQMLLIARERGGNPDDPAKQDPLDFVLWQTSKKGEPFWKSPWALSAGRQGNGRPGWHIECSAMNHQYLGSQIDIHGGGKDLMFPHHESEIAQSESFTGKAPFVKYWLHTAMVLCEGEKMSKSLGNLVMVKDLLREYSANEIRWMLLLHHYRKPWEYDPFEMKVIQYNCKLVAQALARKIDAQDSLQGHVSLKKFESYMDDDLNTEAALLYLLLLANKIVQKRNEKMHWKYQQILKKSLEILGFTF